MRTRLVVAACSPCSALLAAPAAAQSAARPRERAAWSSRRTNSPPRSAPRSSGRAATPSTRRRHGLRARRHPPDRRQHRRRRLHRLPPGRRRSRARTTSARWRRPRPTPTMFLKDGKYNFDLHHNSHLSVGVPGTVAGLHLAWKEHGQAAVEAAGRAGGRAGARRLRGDRGAGALAAGRCSKSMAPYPASLAQFSKNGTPYEAGDLLKQPDLARTLAAHRRPGPGRVLRGRDGRAHREGHGGARRPHHARRTSRPTSRRSATPLDGHLPRLRRSSHAAASARAASALLEMLNILEGYDLKALGFRLGGDHAPDRSRRCAAPFADRARYLGDPDFVPDMPVARLDLEGVRRRRCARPSTPTRASNSSPTTFEWPTESDETTHLSVVDGDRNAVSLTYTLEAGYGSKIVVPGAGFLLNNEMGDFNAGPGPDRRRGADRHARRTWPRPASACCRA